MQQAEMRRLRRDEEQGSSEVNEPWVALQQERWGFTHFIGDDCEPDGHAVELLAYLRGDLSLRTYRTLFST